MRFKCAVFRFFPKDYNFQAKIDAEIKTIKTSNISLNEFGWANYYQLETIHAWLDSLADKYRNVITILDAGKSYEGHTLKGVKLSHKSNNTGVFVEGGIHARFGFVFNFCFIIVQNFIQNIALFDFREGSGSVQLLLHLFSTSC